MSRHPQWEQRLHEFTLKAADKPHEFGSHDCLLAAAGAVKAVTGNDYARRHRGKYKSQASAYRYLKDTFGADSPEVLLNQLLPEIPVGFAQRGDLIVADDGIPGICMGAFALSVTEQGMVRVPRCEWTRAWAVGDRA